MRDQYIRECKKIEQNCIYTAEAHHTIALRSKSAASWYQAVPAAAAAVLAALVGITVLPPWVVWISVVSAAIAAVGSSLNPLKDYYDHLNAAKNFTVLKQDATSLHETFGIRMNEETFASVVESLHTRYNDLVRATPPTDKVAFEKARKRVQEGIHNQD